MVWSIEGHGRKDVMRDRRIIAQQGLTGLFRALARGVALPAAALVPVMELLQQQEGQQGE